MKRELVFLNEQGKDVTTSLIVAEVFGKEHKNVLRDIENLCCSDDFRQLNFEHTPYTHPQNGQIYKMYEMTKDGFSFLVMGYTGKKAGEFKEVFIKEFNKRTMLLSNEDYILARSQEILIRRISDAEKQLEIANEQIALQSKELEKAAPKVKLCDDIYQVNRTYTSTQMAKELGYRSAAEFHNTLKNNGIMFKQSNQWLLTAKYCENGYTTTRTATYNKADSEVGVAISTVWTEKGRLFLHDNFKKLIN